MLLVDERRLPRADAQAPAAVLAQLLGRRVVGDGERRAVVRRLAATRQDVGLAAHVRNSPSFAARVLSALDRDAVPAAFEPLAGHVRTLIAFADALDVRAALRLVAGAAPALEGPVRIDAALLAAEDDAFSWRRLAVGSGVPLEIVDLGPPAPPPLDLAAVEGVASLLRYAGSQADADARRAVIAPQSGVPLDDARALLAAAGDRADLLEVIAKGALAAATRFAHGLTTVTAAYKNPDASAQSVLAAVFAAFPLDDAATRAVLDRIARDFDAARVFAPQWEAADLLTELDAELEGARTRDGLVDDLAPAAPVPDLEPAPVPLRKFSFSASSLNAYAECARKWFFRYACAAVEDRGSSASFYGTAFHAALEDFHGVHVRFDPATDEESLASFLDYCVAAAFDRHRTRFDAPVEFELQKRRARRTAKKYLVWLLERARRAPFEVIGCEATTDVELGGHRFVGFIDRLDRDDRTGTVTVVDYKTGSIATSAEEYLDEVRAFREFQLPFYYWARTAAGDVVTRLALIPLKDALLDVAPVELEVVTTSRPPRSKGATGEIGVGELERAREQMIALADEIAAGRRAVFPATDDPEACRYCAYAESCRERPLALEERFGR